MSATEGSTKLILMPGAPTLEADGLPLHVRPLVVAAESLTLGFVPRTDGDYPTRLRIAGFSLARSAVGEPRTVRDDAAGDLPVAPVTYVPEAGGTIAMRTNETYGLGFEGGAPGAASRWPATSPAGRRAPCTSRATWRSPPPCPIGANKK